MFLFLFFMTNCMFSVTGVIGLVMGNQLAPLLAVKSRILILSHPTDSLEKAMEVDEQVRLSGVENKLVEVEILFLINLTHLLMEKTVNCKTLALG